MEEKVKVLLVDDDIQFGGLLTKELSELGKYDVEYLNNVFGISEAIGTIQPDVLVFDVKIGRENGIEIIEKLYQGNPDLPTIFISSNNTDDMNEKGLLSAGASHYLSKPFTVRALIARIEHSLRNRSYAQDNEHIKRFGNVQFDTCNRALIFENGKIESLRPMEYAIFKILTDHFGQTVSRLALMAAAWEGQEAYYSEQGLNNCIHRLRVMLEKESNLGIKTVRQFGYQLA
jgi:DNA-binding response OmpR family regulator